MTDEKRSHLVPKLRFPEFRDDPPWLASQFSDLYGFKRTNTLSRDKLNYDNGTIKNIHYGDIHTKFKPIFRVSNEHVPYINPDASTDGFDNHSFCEEGDIVLADASEDLDDVGKAIEIVSLDGERVVAGTHTILATRLRSVPIIGFGGQLFQSATVRAGIKKEAQGAKVYGISASRVSTVPVPVPPTEAEQQKISDCLGSLDDLIVAEGQKLETLRQHRQGLMQQLFPEPGESFPRLRFPEFRDKWRTMRLGAVVTEFRANSTVQDEHEVLTSARRGLMRQADYYGTGRITDRNNVGFNIIPPDHLTYRSRSDDGRFYFNHNPFGITGIISVYYPVFRSKNGPNVFLGHLLNRYSAEIGRHSVGTSQRVLPMSALLRFALPVPETQEQQKIAAFVSSLDEMLAAQSRKVEMA